MEVIIVPLPWSSLLVLTMRIQYKKCFFFVIYLPWSYAFTMFSLLCGVKFFGIFTISLACYSID